MAFDQVAVLNSLQAAYQSYAARLADAAASPKPSYVLDGETYNWMEYQQFIIDKMLLLEEAIQRAGGPFELRTQALS